MLRALLTLMQAVGLVVVLAGAGSAEMIYHRGNTGEPETLDPGKASSVPEANILFDLFEGLVMPDARGNIIPGVAQSWQISPDQTVYTFKLRQDAMWSNGDPVTADDFVYAFRRLEDPATAAEYASMLYVVKNAAAINAGKMPPEAMGVRAIDPRTLEITLEAPTPYFLEMLMHQATYPVHRPTIERHGADWTRPGNLVSNGPFVLAARIPNDHVKLVKNSGFHAAADVALDTVIYYPTEDRSTAIKRFGAGELDSNDDLPMEQLADLKRRFPDELRIGAHLGVYYFYVNLRKAPWDKPALRRAVSMAIDRDFLADKVWGGAMIPAYCMVPPGIPGYAPCRPGFSDTPQNEREEEAARILREMGFGPDNPLKLELRYDSSENNTNTGIAIQEQLRPLGIAVSLYNSDLKTHFGHLDGGGDFDLARSGWVADYRDPETFLGIARLKSGNNLGFYKSPEFERLMEESAAAGGDPARRMSLLSQAEKVLVDSDALMPIFYLTSINLVSPRLRGWEDNIMNIHPSRFITVDSR